MFSQLESYLPLFQKYFTAEKKTQFLDSIKDPTSQQIFDLLLSQLFSIEQLKKRMDRLNLNQPLKNWLIQQKIQQFLQTPEAGTNKGLLREIRDRLCSGQNFEHARPIVIKKSDQAQIQPVDSSLRIQQTFEDYIARKLKNDAKFIRQMNNYALSRIPSGSLKELNLDQKEYFLQNCKILYHYSPKFISQFLKEFRDQKRLQDSPAFDFTAVHFQNLSKDQIIAIGDYIPNIFQNQQFVSMWITKNYLDKMREIKNLKLASQKEIAEHRQSLIEVAKDLAKYEHCQVIKIATVEIKNKILDFDILLQDPSLDRLLDYLYGTEGRPKNEVPQDILQRGQRKGSAGSCEQIQGSQDAFPVQKTKNSRQMQQRSVRPQQQQRAYYGKQEIQQVSNFDDFGYNQERFDMDIALPAKKKKNYDQRTEKYIKLLLTLAKEDENSSIIKQLSVFYTAKQLRKTLTLVKLEKGQAVEDLTKYFNQDQIKSLKSRREIKLKQSNKKTYAINDPVILQVSLKNVSKIQIKVYEINFQKYLLSTHGAVDDKINLSFLKSSYTEQYQGKNENPYQIVDALIKVASIPNQMGLYFVDLESQSISSRAVIRKGEIVCVDNLSPKGQVFSFYDQDGNPLTEKQGLKVWIKDKPSVLDAENYISVDFMDQAQSGSIIASVGNFAQLFHKTFLKQQYYIQANYIYNAESFIVGKKAKILLHARLSQGNEKASLSLLKSTKIKINLTNYQGIKSFFQFNYDELSDFQDKQLEFPIQSYVSDIQVNFQSQILLQNGKYVTLNDYHTISIDLGHGSQNFLDLYLDRNEKQQYIINVLGLNGEIAPHVNLLINFAAVGIFELQNFSLSTDNNGQINLGNLSFVKAVQAQIKAADGIIKRKWKINSNNDYAIPHKIYCQLGKQYSLPIDKKWTPKDIIFYSTIKEFIWKDLSSEIKVQDGKLVLPIFSQRPPQDAKYYLYFLPLDNTIEFQLLVGRNLSKETEKQVLFDKQQRRLINFGGNSYRSVTIDRVKSQIKDDKHHLKIDLNTDSLTQEQIKKLRVHVLPTNFISPLIPAVQISKLNNNDQIQEQEYKPQFSTYYSNKTLSEEGAYTLKRQKEAGFIGNNLEKPQIFLKRQFVKETTQIKEDLASGKNFQLEENYHDFGGGGGGPDYPRQKNNPRLMYYNSNPLKSYNNFLANSGHIVSNLKGKSIEVDIPLEYSSAQIYVISAASAISETVSLIGGQTKKKDIKHSGLAQSGKDQGWTMSREVYELKIGQQRLVNRDSLWKTLGLNDIFEYANKKKTKMYSWVSHLLNWHNYSQAKKKTIYDRQCCHQLNTFIKFKDQSFFQSTVKPFIKNKINKSIVDVLLLEDQDISGYTKLEQYYHLNAFQKSLLVRFLLKRGQRQAAEVIVEALQLQQKSKPNNFELFKSSFDTIVYSTEQAAQNTQEATSSNAEITINVKTLTGKTLSFPIWTQDTVQMLKSIVMEKQGIPIDQQRMIFAGKQLQDQLTLKDYKIKNNDTVHLVLRLRGGPSQPSRQEQGSDDEDDDSVGFSKKKEEKQWSGHLKKEKQRKKRAFVPPQSTKEYTQRTYYEVKNYESEGKGLVPHSPFWAELARYFLKEQDKGFISRSFIYFQNAVEFALLAAFVPNSKSSDFDLTNETNHLKIVPKAPLLLYVKQIKKIAYVSKYGVIMNQRFYDPSNKFTYEQDGTRIQREIDSFIIGKAYVVQTVATNTSSTNLQLQLLFDIPKGAIPLKSHDYTEITNINLNSYVSNSYERWFYFPEEGGYYIEPSNVCRGTSIISKAIVRQKIVVRKHHTVNKLQTLSDILLSGNKEQILKYLKTKNIFDNKLFNESQILWMLKEKTFYQEVSQVLTARRYYSQAIWKFAFLHSDTKRIAEYLSINRGRQTAPYFQYFPYYSSRTHQFASQTKSTIRNKQFKEIYCKFLVNSLISIKSEAAFTLAYAYYLIIQDRLAIANSVIAKASKESYESHMLQFDYMRCFLDMSLSSLNFTDAREISSKYQAHPVESWAKLFKQVSKTLQLDDEQFELQVKDKKVEEFQTRVTQQSGEIKIIQPAQTKIIVQIIQLNLQLYFSECPFDQVNTFTSIKPSKQLDFVELAETKQQIIRRSDYPQFKDATIEITELRQGLPPKKITSFTWSNPEVSVKVEQNQGQLTVYLGRKRLSGAYVKVFVKKNGSKQFYRDGYTDMTGLFKYAKSDLEGISQFSIFVATQKGGLIKKANPPSKLASYT